jgi:hypothetical protein
MTETRTVSQTLIWKLVLNPMTGRTEEANLMAWSDDKDKLIKWYNEQLEAEPYRDPGISSFSGGETSWFKVFKKGSQLEWCNPCDLESPSHYGQGLFNEWVDNDAIPNIPSHFYRVW